MEGSERETQRHAFVVQMESYDCIVPPNRLAVRPGEVLRLAGGARIDLPSQLAQLGLLARGLLASPTA